MRPSSTKRYMTTSTTDGDQHHHSLTLGLQEIDAILGSHMSSVDDEEVLRELEELEELDRLASEQSRPISAAAFPAARESMSLILYLPSLTYRSLEHQRQSRWLLAKSLAYRRDRWSWLASLPTTT